MNEETPAPPLYRMAVAVLALVGLLISTYLLLYKLNVMTTLLCGTGGCETVQASPWADFIGVPVPAWGVAGYLLILGLALAGLQPRLVDNRVLARMLLATATFAFAFSAYLTWVEAFLLKAWCRWCVASAIVATLIFIAALFELPALLRSRKPEG
ncbi:MAG: vitamin K epoxide reductase family protein [Gemmatimonadota bacterium]